MAKSKIEWTDSTWNPVTGCTKISAGCKNCYAERMSKRLAGRCGYPADEPFRVTLQPHQLHKPLSWKKPQRIFVCSMGDLFHQDVTDWYIDRVFARMNVAYWHTFIVLTKRAERMWRYLERVRIEKRDNNVGTNERWQLPDTWRDIPATLPNVWLGVSAEHQAAADERIPFLLQTPAAVRFVSVEPMLGPVDFLGIGEFATDSPSPIKPMIDWVICGAESGPRARPFDIDWARSLRDQCTEAGVAYFLKQMPVDGKLTKMPFLDGKQWEEYPTCARG